MTSDELTCWLQAHYGSEEMRPGLTRMREALSPLLDELKKTRIITIVGTNGKGETTLRLSQLLHDHRHCAWTSPHILSITERFISEEGEISLSELELLILQSHQDIRERGISLSFYEFLFFVFCRWAARRNPDFLLLEVGLGGRLDAVNVLDAEIVLLTSISRDHQEILGVRYDGILHEKLGVVRAEAKLLSYLDLNYLRERVRKFAEEKKVQLLDLEQYKLFRPYQFSQRNQLLAYAAFSILEGVNFAQMGARLRQFDSKEYFLPLANRGEVFVQDTEWTFYGSHNPDGLRKLIHFLCSGNYNSKDPDSHVVIASFSKRSETDVRSMMKMLKAMGTETLITSFPHPKAYPSAELQEIAIQEGLAFVHDPLKQVQGRSSQKILVVGSYYFLGHVRSLLSSRVSGS